MVADAIASEHGAGRPGTRPWVLSSCLPLGGNRPGAKPPGAAESNSTRPDDAALVAARGVQRLGRNSLFLRRHDLDLKAARRDGTRQRNDADHADEQSLHEASSSRWPNALVPRCPRLRQTRRAAKPQRKRQMWCDRARFNREPAHRPSARRRQQKNRAPGGYNEATFGTATQRRPTRRNQPASRRSRCSSR